MSKCDKVVGPSGVAGEYMAAGQGCGCVTLDPVTGVLKVDGVPYTGSGGGGAVGPVDPGAAGIKSGALNPGVTVAPSQISPAGPLPAGTTVAAADVTGLCPAVFACVTAAPAGSIPASAIGAGALGAGVTIPGDQVTGGTAGQVLVSNGTKGVWSTPAAGGGATPTAETLGGSALNSAISVPAASITGTLPASAIPCSAVLSCITGAPDGAIPVAKLAGGTTGQVLTTDAAGKPAWAAAPSGGGSGPVSPTASGISAGALNPAVTVAPSQISPAGPLPAGTTVAAADVTGLCPAVIACVSVPGSVPANAIAPGTAGQMLTTNASGQTVWAAAPAGGGGAPTATQIASAMDAATPVTSPAAAGSIAQVYGENAAGAPVTAGPMQVFEAGMAAAPASTNAAPIAFVAGVDAAGKEVKTAVTPVGNTTDSVNTAFAQAATGSDALIVAKVTVPEDGMYNVTMRHKYASSYTGASSNGLANTHYWAVYNGPTPIYLHTTVDALSAIPTVPNNSLVDTDHIWTSVGSFYLKAGVELTLGSYTLSMPRPHNLDINGRIRLTKLSDNNLANPEALAS